MEAYIFFIDRISRDDETKTEERVQNQRAQIVAQCLLLFLIKQGN